MLGSTALHVQIAAFERSLTAYSGSAPSRKAARITVNFSISIVAPGFALRKLDPSTTMRCKLFAGGPYSTETAVHDGAGALKYWLACVCSSRGYALGAGRGMYVRSPSASSVLKATGKGGEGRGGVDRTGYLARNSVEAKPQVNPGQDGHRPEGLHGKEPWRGVKGSWARGVGVGLRDFGGKSLEMFHPLDALEMMANRGNGGNGVKGTGYLREKWHGE